MSSDAIPSWPKVQFETMFPWEIAEAMAKAPLAYQPLGTLEWHGEHNAVGLDSIKAHAVCVRAAQRSGGLVLPPLYWAADSREDLPDGSYLTGGVEGGERYHVPGNMFWLRPETYYNLLLDLYESMRRRGFRAILVVTGHWSSGSLPTMRASGEAFTRAHPEMRWRLLMDRELIGADERVAGLPYPHEHAAGGETSLLMAIRPDLVDLSKTLETDHSLRKYYTGQPDHLKRRAETNYKYIGVLRGVGDETNDPELSASVERGKALLDLIAQRLANEAKALLA